MVKLTVPISPSFSHRPQKKIAHKSQAVQVKVERKPATKIAPDTNSSPATSTGHYRTPAKPATQEATVFFFIHQGKGEAMVREKRMQYCQVPPCTLLVPRT